jgi:hypothetical protein
MVRSIFNPAARCESEWPAGFPKLVYTPQTKTGQAMGLAGFKKRFFYRCDPLGGQGTRFALSNFVLIPI